MKLIHVHHFTYLLNDSNFVSKAYHCCCGSQRYETYYATYYISGRQAARGPQKRVRAVPGAVIKEQFAKQQARIRELETELKEWQERYGDMLINYADHLIEKAKSLSQGLPPHIANQVTQIVRQQVEQAFKPVRFRERFEEIRLAQAAEFPEGSKLFGFIIEPEKNGPDAARLYMTIRAESLNEAAYAVVSFLERHPEWENPGVDYEVDFEGQYLDLNQLGEQHSIYQYLT